MKTLTLRLRCSSPTQTDSSSALALSPLTTLPLSSPLTRLCWPSHSLGAHYSPRRSANGGRLSFLCVASLCPPSSIVSSHLLHRLRRVLRFTLCCFRLPYPLPCLCHLSPTSLFLSLHLEWSLSFMAIHIGGETDLRFVYLAAAICFMLDN
ncbi:Geranylgeranyltransferase type I beta subunit [Arachis hypogaea]|nr:Geranylgeranyltransferase type I beta subunit [Arachis hypogaea]